MRVETSVISTLNANGEMSATEIAAILRLSPGVVANALSRLLKFGAVKKRRYVSGEVTWLPKLNPNEFKELVKTQRERAMKLRIIGSPLRVFVVLEPQYGLLLKQLSEHSGISVQSLIQDAVKARIPHWLRELIEPGLASKLIAEVEKEVLYERAEAGATD